MRLCEYFIRKDSKLPKLLDPLPAGRQAWSSQRMTKRIENQYNFMKQKKPHLWRCGFWNCDGSKS
ncbi:MAG: hypothetical protein COV43_06775 [Deltaproteobacteria bacterium CG11_big_fil_rev_8_21_14_0_20_42_23]|nr:MAG: hypothetical protein COV43_06775 [Deltaproteobacteria bacterium CG11_big_fil_rev_8_21_14_0_20_42_23]PJC65219.1 MAG: hypothetical protein CO021_00080 [Deltaproteobacteria bacterium CG_4_9_14_0_2_um_filter_42_21]